MPTVHDSSWCNSVLLLRNGSGACQEANVQVSKPAVHYTSIMQKPQQWLCMLVALTRLSRGQHNGDCKAAWMHL